MTPRVVEITAAQRVEKHTFRFYNEPMKFLGVLDSQYAQWCIFPAVLCGLFAATTWLGRIFVAAVAFAVFAWQAQRIADDDRQTPYIWWLTLTDKSHACAFTQKKGAK